MTNSMKQGLVVLATLVVGLTGGCGTAGLARQTMDDTAMALRDSQQESQRALRMIERRACASVAVEACYATYSADSILLACLADNLGQCEASGGTIPAGVDVMLATRAEK